VVERAGGLLGSTGDLRMALIYLLIGIQASGKSWICRQLTHKFNYIAHDRCWYHPQRRPPTKRAENPAWGPPGSTSTHLKTLIREAKTSTKPIITEVPFGESDLIDRVQLAGLKAIPIFVTGDLNTIRLRYRDREGKRLPKNAETRALTFEKRAQEWGAVHGSSTEILAYLEGLPAV